MSLPSAFSRTDALEQRMGDFVVFRDKTNLSIVDMISFRVNITMRVDALVSAVNSLAGEPLIEAAALSLKASRALRPEQGDESPTTGQSPQASHVPEASAPPEVALHSPVTPLRPDALMSPTIQAMDASTSDAVHESKYNAML